MELNYFVAVDLQNDFITGTLANKEADKKVIPAIVEFLKENLPKAEVNSSGYSFVNFYATADTHFVSSLPYTAEKDFPEHCIYNTWGWEFDDRVKEYLVGEKSNVHVIQKPTFGSVDLVRVISNDIDDNIDRLVRYEGVYYKEVEPIVTLFGLDTDYCVVSNAIMLRNFIPNAKVRVLKDLCAGSTPETSEAALLTMKTLGIEIC